MPPEMRGVENVALQVYETDGAEAQLPNRTSGMEEIEVCHKMWSCDGSCHRKTAFEQGPIERLAVEGEEHGAIGEPRSQLVQKRMFFGEVAHEELLDFEAACLPPSDPDEKCVRAGASGETGRLGVEKKPLGRISERGARPAREWFAAGAREKIQGDCRRFGKFGRREPVADGQ